MIEYTLRINISGMLYKKLIRFPKSPRYAIVEFSLTGKLISQANSKVRARTAEHPQTSP